MFTPRCGRNDAEGYGGKHSYREQAVKLACHHVPPADVGVKCLFPQQDMEAPVTLVEEPLAFHAGRDSAVEIISYLMELDAEAHDFPCILRGLEHAIDNRGVIGTEHLCLLSKGDGDLLPPPGPQGQLLAPLNPQRFDAAQGRDEIRNLILGVGVNAPCPDIALGGVLLPVLDAADLR